MLEFFEELYNNLFVYLPNRQFLRNFEETGRVANFISVSCNDESLGKLIAQSDTKSDWGVRPLVIARGPYTHYRLDNRSPRDSVISFSVDYDKFMVALIPREFFDQKER